MRNRQIFGSKQEVAVVDDVDIECAWSPMYEAFAAAAGFDLVDGGQQLLWREQGIDLYSTVEERGLFGKALFRSSWKGVSREYPDVRKAASGQHQDVRRAVQCCYRGRGWPASSRVRWSLQGRPAADQLVLKAF